MYFPGTDFVARHWTGLPARQKMSKPNLLYYFSSKEEIHIALLTKLLDVWLAPLRNLRADGDPREELSLYIQNKLQMSRELPRRVPPVRK